MSARKLSAAQIADLRLAGMPTTKVGVIDRARREGWIAHPRSGRGGGFVYDVSEFHREARDAWAERVSAGMLAEVEKSGPPALIDQGTAQLADWQREPAIARLVVLEKLAPFIAAHGKMGGIRSFVKKVAGRQDEELSRMLASANARGGATGSRTVSERTLRRWLDLADGGVAALALKQPDVVKETPAWAPYLMALRAKYSKPKLAWVLRKLRDHLPEGMEMPSRGQAQRWLDKLSVDERETGRLGPSAKRALKPHKRVDWSEVAPLRLIMADGHTLKAYVSHPGHGNAFRPEVCLAMDATTRMIVGWSIGLSETANVVIDAFHMVIRNWGYFDELYTDNGSGFVSGKMTDEVTGFLARTRTAATNSLPGRAQSRGAIERIMSTVLITFARSLPTYCGDDVDSEAHKRTMQLVARDIKKHGMSRQLLAWEAFEAELVSAIAAYNTAPHTSLPRYRDPIKGTWCHPTPAESMNARLGERAQSFATPDDLRDLKRTYETRKVQRAEISWYNNIYFAPELRDLGGQEVQVGQDLDDKSHIYVKDLSGRFIAQAIHLGNSSKWMGLTLAEREAEKRHKGRVGRALDRIAEADAELGRKVLEHAPQIPRPHFLDASIDAEHALLQAAIGSPPLALPAAQLTRAEPETRQDIEARWLEKALRLRAAKDAGEELSARDAAWLADHSDAHWLMRGLACWRCSPLLPFVAPRGRSAGHEQRHAGNHPRRDRRCHARRAAHRHRASL